MIKEFILGSKVLNKLHKNCLKKGVGKLFIVETLSVASVLSDGPGMSCKTIGAYLGSDNLRR